MNKKKEKRRLKLEGKLRYRLWKRFKACEYCGMHLEYEKSTLDHIHPKSKGGTYDLENIALACHTCNNDKGDMDVDEWLFWIAFETSLLEECMSAGFDEDEDDDDFFNELGEEAGGQAEDDEEMSDDFDPDEFTDEDDEDD